MSSTESDAEGPVVPEDEEATPVRPEIGVATEFNMASKSSKVKAYMIRLRMIEAKTENRYNWSFQEN
jgi:hypothetical protein